MVYYHSESRPHFHDWKNYSYKGVSNPIPQFKFPTGRVPQTTTLQPTHIPETTTMEAVTNFIKDWFTPAASTNAETLTESSVVSSTIPTEIINDTFTDVVGLMPNNTITESMGSNSTLIPDIMVNTTGSSMTDLMLNGSMPIDAGLNSTNLMGNTNTILTTVSEIASSTAANTASIITSTTEKAATFVTEVVQTVSTSTEANHRDHAPHYYYAMGSHRILYVILLVILAILVLIGVMVLLIYIRYRKNSFRFLQNYYEVSPMKERTPSDNGRDEQKQIAPEIFMHYQC